MIARGIRGRGKNQPTALLLKAMKAFFLAFFLTPFFALGASPVLRPDPLDFSQISQFRAEFCASRIEPAWDINALCLGKSLFRSSTQVRSLLVVKTSGEKNLYVEDQWPAIELLKPSFGLIGPVHAHSASRTEFGRVRLSLDAQGEVEAFTLWTPSLGTVQAYR
jgi:hypothetical protein